MKLTLARRDLHPAIAAVTRVVERRNTLPILSNLVLEATPAGLRLRATDLDMEISTLVTAEVDEPGAITVPAARLHDIVGKLGDGQVRIEAAGNTASEVKITAGRARFWLPALPTSDYPSLDAGELPWSFALPADLFGAALDAVGFAISTEETRYYLNGVFLHAATVAGADRLAFVATDGHRLSLVRRDLPEGASGMPGVIVPRKTVAEISKLCRGNPKEARLALSDGKIRFELGDTVLLSKLIDGAFPDYDRVIPTGATTFATLARAEVKDAADRVLTVAGERGRAIKATFDAGATEMRLEVVNPDAGQAAETLGLGSIDGDGVVIGLNGRYLVDALEAMSGDAIRLGLSDPGSPVLMTPADDPEGARRLVVVMPMRV